MNLVLRNKYLSNARYLRYLIAVNHQHKKADDLYIANIQLAQAFHSVLSQFEVIFRNSLHNSLILYFNDPNWIINQKNLMMNHNSLASSNFYLKSSILKTEKKLTQRGLPITSGKIISDQTFGFWLSFFLSHHFTLVGGKTIQIFKYKPPFENRSTIYNKLVSIKDFRNRVNHCEPICFLGNSIDCTNALQIRTFIFDMISWIDPNLISFFDSIDNIDNRIIQVQNI